VLQPLLADSSGIQAEAKDLHADQALHDAVADGTLWGDEMGIYDGMQLMNATLPTTPPVGVKIRDMSYTVRKNARMSGVETVGSMVVKFFMALTCIPCFRVAICGMKFVSKKVLRNVNITIRPGMLTLVLGPPGCGKSCLLRAVRGDLPGGMGHSVTGEVLYNDQSPDSGAYVLPKLAAYVPQTDFHTALMTVTETFAFAFDCMEAGRHAAWLDKSEMTEEMQATLKMMDEKKAKVRVLIKVLGLVNAKDTIVGNAFVRGVSGGEKRRVSCGEMLVGSTSVLLLDSISNGLDSSTTHDIICALSRAAQTFNKTIAVALLQPPPLTFEVFQRLVLMAEGYIIFSGPTSEALPYFQSLGFFLPERKDVADWLVELPTSQVRLHILLAKFFIGPLFLLLTALACASLLAPRDLNT
jgi:ABC-type multidrug transport system ATPase subunit